MGNKFSGIVKKICSLLMLGSVSTAVFVVVVVMSSFSLFFT